MYSINISAYSATLLFHFIDIIRYICIIYINMYIQVDKTAVNENKSSSYFDPIKSNPVKPFANIIILLIYFSEPSYF